MEENVILANPVAPGTYDEPKPEGVTTTVTSIAQEEAKTGQKLDLPQGEDLVGRIAAAHTSHLVLFNRIFKDLSSKEKSKVTSGLLALPTDDLKVTFTSQEGIECFKLGQQVQVYRLILIQDRVQKDVQKAKKELEEEKKAKEQPKLNELSGDLGVIGGDTPRIPPNLRLNGL